MTKKSFFKAVGGGEVDLVQLILFLLKETNSPYCVIGGLGVNAYVDPVVSLDLDLVVLAEKRDAFCTVALTKGMRIETFEQSINLSIAGSDLRIQLQKDPLYQAFIKRAQYRNVLGYEMAVADLEDLLQGKLWAYLDKRRRNSKRQKDLADILRLVETYPNLACRLPEGIL